MAKENKENKGYDLSLLQKNPSREVLLNKMREKLAGSSMDLQEKEQRLKQVRKRLNRAWIWKFSVAALLIAANVLLYTQKERIIVTLGFEGVPALPGPKASLDPDDQALYWTYALYDFDRLQSTFGVTDRYAINAVAARKALQELLPQVGMSTLGEIATYGPIGLYQAGRSP